MHPSPHALEPPDDHAAATANILGVNVSAMTVGDLHGLIRDAILDNKKALLLNVNAHALNLAYENPWLRDFFNQSEAVFPDGTGALVAARLQGVPFRARVTYADWMWDLAGLCVDNEFSLYLLGSRPGVADQASQALIEANPGLRILGTHHGYFDHSPDSQANLEVVAEINRLQPDILIVALGMPLQERWLMENWDRLRVHVGLTGGGVFDYVSGRLRRPPRFLADHGLEWLGRLAIEPGRLWRRYLLGIPLFMFRVIRQANELRRQA